MAILGLCIPAMYMNIMLSQVLIAMNRQASWTWVMGVTTIINPLFNLALIPLDPAPRTTTARSERRSVCC